MLQMFELITLLLVSLVVCMENGYFEAVLWCTYLKYCNPFFSSTDAHARSKDVEEAEALLDHLISACANDSSLTPDSFSFQSVCVLPSLSVSFVLSFVL